MAFSTKFLSGLIPFFALPLTPVGRVILPRLMFDRIQIFACALFAQRYRSTDGAEMGLAGSGVS